MAVKILHAGNIAVAFGAVATAADLTLTGGAGALITSTLSGVEIFKKAEPAQKELAKDMAQAAQTHLQTTNLHGDRRKIVIQMMAIYAPDYAEMAKGNMDAPTVATNICKRIKKTGADAEHKSDAALTDYNAFLIAVLTPLLEPQTPEQAMQQELLRRVEVSGEAQRLHDAGVDEKAILKLAKRIGGEAKDLDAAWAELQNAFEIAVRIQRDGHTASNDRFVDQVMQQVAEHSAQGEYAKAKAALAEAEAQDEAAFQARRIRFLGKRIDIALLEGASEEAAQRLIEQADVEAGGTAAFKGLRKLRRQYYETGRDKGIALDLEVAINLAQRVLARAGNADERGMAQNDLGNALWVLGERESGTARLEQAVAAYEAALEECTQERVPLDWAATQNNLGNALRTLGARESGTARLEQAVAAYEAALQEYTQERVPLDWAMTQNNLGNALQALGQRESGTARLEQAVAAYEAALQERTQERVPLSWATTQNNLGTALQTLGARESGTARLEQAVAAYEAALQEWTQERVPLDWAATQNNLGNALATLGARESSTARLEQAVAAYEAALQERTQERVPFDWAVSQHCLSGLELAFFDKEPNPARLDKAMDYATAARDVYEAGGAAHYVDWIDGRIDEIKSRRG